MNKTNNELTKAEFIQQFNNLYEYMDKKFNILDKKIDLVDNKIDLVESRLNEKIDLVDNKIDLVESRLNEKIDMIDNKVSATEIKLNKRISENGLKLKESFSKDLGKIQKHMNEMDKKLKGFEQNMSYSFRVEEEITKKVMSYFSNKMIKSSVFNIKNKFINETNKIQPHSHKKDQAYIFDCLEMDNILLEIDGLISVEYFGVKNETISEIVFIEAKLIFSQSDLEKKLNQFFRIKQLLQNIENLHKEKPDNRYIRLLNIICFRLIFMGGRY